MKKFLALFLMFALLLTMASAREAAEETVIVLGETVTVNGAPITEDTTAPVYMAYVVELHSDVPEDRAGLPNSVVTIATAGTYRVSGTAENTQLAVRAGENDRVRVILDGVDITCRTAPAIAVFSGFDPKTPGEYGVVIELADDSYNIVRGSHTKRILDTDTKMDGAIDSLISLGFEGTNGRLDVEADNEGIEVKFGHMTINGGVFHINAADDPLNVSEDFVGVLTMNDGYLFSAVRNEEGGEGDGIDSNGYIYFNGGTAINLAHPGSMDGGIDSDMGSYINGGLIVGAGNMYDEVEKDSAQLFMMLEFAESTDDLLVVTNSEGVPVFAFDFPHDFMYICFSTPHLIEGEIYHVYLGGEIVGTQEDGLYTAIESYVPGRQLHHGAGVAEMRTDIAMPAMDEDASSGEQAPAFDEGQSSGDSAGEQAPAFDESQSSGDSAGQQAPAGEEGASNGDSAGDPAMGEDASFGGPAGMQSSSEVATGDFLLTRESCTYSNLTVGE
ncbi:MAG: carbohydrate-binding domain-containing protein [Clostridia bacterium]|nr:carbohydrate-binding domain-containing protein [Clostridia bacterium]